MGREALSFNEGCMAEIIEVIQAGLNHLGDAVDQDIREHLEEWIDGSAEYAQQMDRREI